jgi:hypothetical protein
MKILLIAVSALALLAGAPAFANNINQNKAPVDQATDGNRAQIQTYYKPSLRYYAIDALPMLRAHLIEARRLLKHEGVSAKVPPVTSPVRPRRRQYHPRQPGRRHRPRQARDLPERRP